MITKMFLKSAKVALSVFLGKGWYMANIDRIDQIDQMQKSRDIWSINNQNWSSFFLQIDHTISFHLLALQALVNLVKFFRYTPPHERNSREFGQCSHDFLTKNLTTRLTTNEESTTYKGCFLPLFPKWVKSFVFNTALQSKNLTQFGQVFRLEKVTYEKG